MREWNGRPARIAIVGAGAFGQALAVCCINAGVQVTMFNRDEKGLEILRQDAQFAACEFVSIPNWNGDFASFDLVLLSIPCQVLRQIGIWITDSLIRFHKSVEKIPELFVVSAAKGIEQKTVLLPHQILAEVLPKAAKIGTLSGPSFAKELRAGLPTAVVLASQSPEMHHRAETLLHRSFFRVYGSDDIVGVEIGGALKNVIALVAGAVDGLELGHNARAAVITRGLGEITQVGMKLGAQPLTFLGLSGLGDLILTCTGDLSRNRQFGLRMARGESASSIIESMGQVIEGFTTAQSAFELVTKLQLDTPILKLVHLVAAGKIPVRDALMTLLNRSQKGEFDWITPS